MRTAHPQGRRRRGHLVAPSTRVQAGPPPQTIERGGAAVRQFLATFTMPKEVVESGQLRWEHKTAQDKGWTQYSADHSKQLSEVWVHVRIRPPNLPPAAAPAEPLPYPCHRLCSRGFCVCVPVSQPLRSP